MVGFEARESFHTGKELEATREELEATKDAKLPEKQELVRSEELLEKLDEFWTFNRM
jgi:hypothetical protein